MKNSYRNEILNFHCCIKISCYSIGCEDCFVVVTTWQSQCPISVKIGTCCFVCPLTGQLGWWWRRGEKSRDDKNRWGLFYNIHTMCWVLNTKLAVTRHCVFLSESKVSDKKKLMEKIKEKENRLKKKQQDLKKQMENTVNIFLPFILCTLCLCLIYSPSVCLVIVGTRTHTWGWACREVKSEEVTRRFGLGVSKWRFRWVLNPFKMLAFWLWFFFFSLTKSWFLSF